MWWAALQRAFVDSVGNKLEVISETWTEMLLMNFFSFPLSNPTNAWHYYQGLYQNLLQSVRVSLLKLYVTGRSNLLEAKAYTLRLCLISPPSPLTLVWSKFLLMLLEVHKEIKQPVCLWHTTLFSKQCLLLLHINGNVHSLLHCLPPLNSFYDPWLKDFFFY